MTTIMATTMAMTTAIPTRIKRMHARAVLLLALSGALAQAQTPGYTNASVSGNFFFRLMQFTTNTSSVFTDARSAFGTITFNGAGQYTINAIQTIDTLASTSLTGSGSYSIASNGAMSIGNPLRNTLNINARVGAEAIIGSTTESGDNTFDLFIAVPAATAAQALSNFTGNYYVSEISFPLSVGTYASTAFFNMIPGTGGEFSLLAGVGHSLETNAGAVTNVNLSGSSAYSFNGDGTVTANFGALSTIVTGEEELLVSASGDILIGASLALGTQDLFVAVREDSATAALANWNGLYYTGGIRYDAKNATTAAYVGSSNAVPSLGIIPSYQREHQIATTPGAFDLTGYQTFTLNSTGTYTDTLLDLVGLGPSGTSYVQADLATQDDNEGFSIDFGIAADALSGTGVYINPQGILNGASFSPTGQPIAPGEFITIFGTGLAAAETVASAPYPVTLGGVSVTINGYSAPVYLVSPNQLNVLVPYAVTGATATIVVTNNGAVSNTVVYPLSTTAPGVFTTNSTGTGAGAILHSSNNTLVTSSSPAKKGETVSVYLTGLGAVTPAVLDGTAGLSNPLSTVNEAVAVTVGNLNATVTYAGLAPGLPGLYQINFTVPSALSGTGNIGFAVQTPEAFSEQATIAIQ